MVKFLKKIFLFFIPLVLVFFSGIFLPPTPRASKSFLFANALKDSLLKHTDSPRIIFIGGSNLSFGLNSYLIKDSLDINPINTAVNANIGIKYMLENTFQYIKKKDIIIVSLEYSHFYQPYDYTSDELLRTIFDVCPEKRKLLSFNQKISLLKYLPKYSLSKLNPSEYWGYIESDIYSVNSFNKYGDTDAHWNLENREFNPGPINGEFNPNIIKELKKFEDKAKNIGALVFITFPSYVETSFKISEEKILKVERVLEENDFILLGNSKKYTFPPDMMFNTNYHLNKKGLDYRTNLLIQDYKKILTKTTLLN